MPVSFRSRSSKQWAKLAGILFFFLDLQNFTVNRDSWSYSGFGLLRENYKVYLASVSPHKACKVLSSSVWLALWVPWVSQPSRAIVFGLGSIFLPTEVEKLTERPMSSVTDMKSGSSFWCLLFIRNMYFRGKVTVD